MINDCPKLYAMIWQYLSQESKDEVKRSEDFEIIKNTRDAQGCGRLSRRLTRCSRSAGLRQ
jgi:hypothetical protein